MTGQLRLDLGPILHRMADVLTLLSRPPATRVAGKDEPAAAPPPTRETVLLVAHSRLLRETLFLFRTGQTVRTPR